MRYRVRTPDGELDYGSMRDVEVAYIQGLVGPDDEVREEGKETWRKASTIPILARARPPAQGLMARPQLLSILAAVVLGACSLMLVLSESWTRRALGIVLALAMSTLLTRVTFKAFKRPGTPKS
jgi:hypothetical protein